MGHQCRSGLNKPVNDSDTSRSLTDWPGGMQVRQDMQASKSRRDELRHTTHLPMRLWCDCATV